MMSYLGVFYGFVLEDSAAIKALLTSSGSSRNKSSFLKLRSPGDGLPLNFESSYSFKKLISFTLGPTILWDSHKKNNELKIAVIAKQIITS